MRPGSEKETSRLLAKEEVARAELAHLIRTDAPAARLKWSAKTAHEYAVALEKTLAARTQMGKEKLSQVVYTTEEWKQLKEYGQSRDVAARDNRAAARLQATRIMAGAELKEAQAKVDAFETSRHFWKFDVEGWGKMSLREVEVKIKHHTEAKFTLRNFLRPTKRESIQRTIEYFQDIKKDVQKQIAIAGNNIDKDVGAAQLKYDVASKLVEKAERERAAQGKPMPAPNFEQGELPKLVDIANRIKDAKLLAFVYEETKEALLANPTPESLSAVKGNAVIARMEMHKAADRLKAAIEYNDFRQLPIGDPQSLTYTKSVREVEPKSAIEALIRHFTDSPDRKQERRSLADAKSHQLSVAQARSRDARDYSVMRDRIAHDFYRAAGAREADVAPNLNREQVAELREYAETLPYLSRDRKEFRQAAGMAEQRLIEREAEAATRECQQPRTAELAGRQAADHEQHDTITTKTERSDGVSYRGR